MKPNSYFKTLVSAYAVSTFSEGFIMPIYAIFVQKIGGDILDASGAVAIFLIVSGITTILIHRTKWSENHRVKLMIIGWLVWTLGICGYFIISNVWTLFVTQVCVALGNAIANPAFDAELDDNTDENIKSYEWGLFEALQDIVGGLAAIIGGLVASLFGFKILIMLMIATATGSFLMILSYVKLKNKPNFQVSPGV